MSNSADAKPDERNPMSASASVARHPRPPELVGATLEDIAARYVARFRERKADWAAFEDAKLEGYKRAQHRFIGAGGSGKQRSRTLPRAMWRGFASARPTGLHSRTRSSRATSARSTASSARAARASTPTPR